MINVELDEDRGIAIVRPGGPLTKEDLEAVGAQIDPYIEQHGSLDGLVISTDRFPGWRNPAALVSHLNFVNDHHRKIGKVAVVSDSELLDLMPRLVDHFVKAEVRHFDAAQLDAAIAWAGSSSPGS